MDEIDWHWQKLKIKTKLKKEGIYYELWRTWWAICTTTIKRKIK